MKRLTERFDDGILKGVLVKEKYGEHVPKTLFEEVDEGYLGMCVLKAYEDTGLSVSDIQILKEQLFRKNASEITRSSRDNEVTECCPHCDREITVSWNVERDGLEKILEEIDIKIAGSMGKKREGLLEAREIIRKHMNDGWIPVEERLPEEKKSVLVQWEKYDRHLNVTLTYLDVMWLDDAEEKVFETINGVPNGKVIAWRPLPEPYRPERSSDEKE